jgi:hypothetical protein
MHEAIRHTPVGGKKLVTIGHPAAMRLGTTEGEKERCARPSTLVELPASDRRLV